MRHPIRTLIGAAIALVLLLVAAGSVAAHHSEPGGPCETLTVKSEEGTIVRLTPGDLEFGPLGPGEWPTTYVLSPVPGGDYHVTFWKGDTLDAENDAIVEACASPTPRPTPTVVGHTPRPHVVPPPTDTADAEPALSWTDVGVAILLILALTGYVEWRWPELRNRKR